MAPGGAEDETMTWREMTLWFVTACNLITIALSVSTVMRGRKTRESIRQTSVDLKELTERAERLER